MGIEKKSIIKSVRLKPSTYDIVLNYAGKGFNQKFENIIACCYKDLPVLHEKIEAKKKELADLEEQLNRKRHIIQDLDDLKFCLLRVFSIKNKIDEHQKGEDEE